MIIGERAMSLQKQLLIFLLAFAGIGTIANWLMKVHEGNLAKTAELTKLRIQQIRDECTRKLAEQHEEYQQSWDKKLKELDTARSEEVDAEVSKQNTKLSETNAEHIRKLDILKDNNDELRAERDRLRVQLDNITGHYSKYKIQMEGANTVSVNDGFTNGEDLQQTNAQDGEASRTETIVEASDHEPS